MNRPRLHSLVAILVLALAAGAAGCDHLSGPGGGGETARARVTTDAAELSVTIVTSTRFRAVRGRDGVSVNLLSADTAVRELPYDRTHDIAESGRFFVAVEAADTTGVPVTLRASVGGDERFRRTAPVGEETLTFVYRAR